MSKPFTSTSSVQATKLICRNQPLPDRGRGCLRPIVDVKLLKDDGQFVLDGLLRKMNRLSNLFVGRALGKQAQDLDLLLVRVKLFSLPLSQAPEFL